MIISYQEMTKYLDERFTKKTLQLKRDRNADIRDSVELRVCFFWYKKYMQKSCR